MLLRRKTTHTGDKPLNGANIVGCTHITAQAAVSQFLQYNTRQIYCKDNLINISVSMGREGGRMYLY